VRLYNFRWRQKWDWRYVCPNIFGHSWLYTVYQAAPWRPFCAFHTGFCIQFPLFIHKIIQLLAHHFPELYSSISQIFLFTKLVFFMLIIVQIPSCCALCNLPEPVLVFVKCGLLFPTFGHIPVTYSRQKSSRRLVILGNRDRILRKRGPVQANCRERTGGYLDYWWAWKNKLVNKKICRDTEYSSGEMMGKELYDFMMKRGNCMQKPVWKGAKGAPGSCLIYGI